MHLRVKTISKAKTIERLIKYIAKVHVILLVKTLNTRISIVMLVVASWRQLNGVLSAIRFLYLDWTCFISQNVLLHTHVLPNIKP